MSKRCRGQRDFRGLWLGEINDAECILFMLDAHAEQRFKEAKKELWKLSNAIENKPLFILANKYDLSPIAPIATIIQELELMKLPQFEVLPISCKTGYGIVNGFSKIYYRLTGKFLNKKIKPIALTIFNQGGVPLTTREGECSEKDILHGGFFTAITNFAKESFQSELNQLRLDGKLIIFKKSKNFMGSLVIDESQSLDINEAEYCLKELLEHLENMCPSVDTAEFDAEQIEYLVKQYSTNIFK